MDDCIEVRGLRVVGTHGVLPEEQTRAQPFEVDLTLSVDLSAAADSDDLADTVDYGKVVEQAVVVVGGSRSYRLLEALAGGIADRVLDDERVMSVTVVVRKLRPPLPADVASVAARITRHR